VPIRTGEPSDAAFIVEMARLASAVEGRPLPPVDDPLLVQGLPPSPDTSVLALDHNGHPIGAWWHFRQPPLIVTPDSAAVPELVVAVIPADRGHGVGRCLLDALAAHAAQHGYDRLALNVHIRNPQSGSTVRLASSSQGRAAVRSASPWFTTCSELITSGQPTAMASHGAAAQPEAGNNQAQSVEVRTFAGADDRVRIVAYASCSGAARRPHRWS
jgi:GNAT superfamily N-acetyltransferase